jgi:hypothetical protein
LKIMRLNDLEVSEVLVVLGYISWVLALTHLKHRWVYDIYTVSMYIFLSFYRSIFLSFFYLSFHLYLYRYVYLANYICVDPAASERFTHLEVVKPWVPKGPRSMAPATNLRQASCWINRLIPSFSYKYADQYFSIIICSHIKKYTFLIWSSTGKGSRYKQHNPTVRHFRSSLAGLANAEGSSSGTGRPLRRLAVTLAVALNFHNDIMGYKFVFTRVFLNL